MIQKAFGDDAMSVAQMLQRWLRICWKWSMFWNACNKQNTWEWWMCMGCNQQRSVTQVTQPPYSPDLVPRDFWPFPKLKSPLKGERFQWDSGKYDGAADGDWENCVRSQGAYFEGDWGVIVLCTMYLVSSSINVYFSYGMAGYLLDRPCIKA